MMSSRGLIPAADRISDLPDSILCHILSFLSTKHSASTSVLSKRWKLLWLSVLTLHFDNTSRILFPIYSTMLQRDIALPIHSFCFIFNQHFPLYQTYINQFIEIVIEIVRRSGVQNFILDLNVSFIEPSFELPQNILNCETLEVLKLKGVKVGDISHMQDLHLPKLKTLHLDHVLFECNQQLYNLLLGCPLLRDFESKHSVNFEDNHLPETSKALPNLIKAKLNDDLIRYPLSMLCDTMIFCVDLSKRSRFFNNLVLFRNFPAFQRLTHLELNFQDIDWLDRSVWLLELLKHSPKLQNLIIQDTGVLKERNGICWNDPQIAPKCISSQLKTCCISGYKGIEWDFKFAKYIIENSKVLDTMTIHSKRSIGMNDKDKMLDELSSCTKASTTCKLLFD